MTNNVSKTVEAKWFTNNGTEVRRTFNSVEDAILAGRNARRDRGANFRKYRLSGETEWKDL